MVKLFRLPFTLMFFPPLRWMIKWMYQWSGRKPWTRWYKIYKHHAIDDLVKNQLALFDANQPLPAAYGIGMDERVIEYPWVFARLSTTQGWLLDAGSVLNRPYLLAHERLQVKNTIILTLAPENWMFPAPNVSYLFGDLRATVLRDAQFDEIICISTLEHIGQDNTLIYTAEGRYKESQPDDYLVVVQELLRLLKPSGSLLLTTPYGKHQNLGWLQQFDRERLQKITALAEVKEQVFYRYTASGWQLATQTECDDCEYFDIHSQPHIDADLAAAARAVVCLRLNRN